VAAGQVASIATSSGAALRAFVQLGGGCGGVPRSLRFPKATAKITDERRWPGSVSYSDRKRVAAALRPIYTAATVEAAESPGITFWGSGIGSAGCLIGPTAASNRPSRRVGFSLPRPTVCSSAASVA
jgi:hypothetical protein